MELHPQVIGKGSRDVFVALPLEEYEVLTEMMEDYEDMLDLRAAKEQAKGQKGIPLDQAIAELGIEHLFFRYLKMVPVSGFEPPTY
uniref:Type II toxin-antitoxin system Phd/YefM family antitoxin n=1 Tax=Candidatus Kentrum sp. UNK TaxID=2126344 RepID=A0A451AN47_9GAMM|nr:MAG: hypothetical protein BECKUNK1418G_GA0071005_11449 [Candidatus Kentron sp. UNK]VFK72890.1 MAG: hypothetical protein BECKUNK1418H_GA0071006_11473 [Candidatus Kentron sp. UNK]